MVSGGRSCLIEVRTVSVPTCQWCHLSVRCWSGAGSAARAATQRADQPAMANPRLLALLLAGTASAQQPNFLPRVRTRFRTARSAVGRVVSVALCVAASPGSRARPQSLRALRLTPLRCGAFSRSRPRVCLAQTCGGTPHVAAFEATVQTSIASTGYGAYQTCGTQRICSRRQSPSVSSTGRGPFLGQAVADYSPRASWPLALRSCAG